MRRLWARYPDGCAAVLVGAVVFLGLALTAQMGFVRDEGYYFRAAREYHRWFEGLWSDPANAFRDATLTRAFGYNTEHPGFAKLFMGWTWKIFHVWLGLVGNALGYRLASMAMVATGAAFLYLLGKARFGRATALVAVALLFLCPHVFYHSHLACFDGPIMATSVICAYAFHRSLSARRAVVGVGLAFGVALATKHNAVFFVPIFALAYGLANRSGFGFQGGLRLPPLPLAFISMAVLGPVVLYLTYPYGWHAPIERLGAYYAYHARHENYPVDYFGTLYRDPPFPWSYPYVMSAITMPVTVLVTGLGGFVVLLVRALRRSAARSASPNADLVLDWLILLSILVPPFIIAIPSVPIFGGTKHWMPMMPFFCLCAAWTVTSAARALPRTAGVALLALVLLLPLAETVRSHPLGHTYFSELVGGHQGGAALGMPRTFWGGDGGLLLGALSREASPGASVFTHRMNQDDFRAYQADGLVRSDLRWTNDLSRADWALTYHQREYEEAEYGVWARTGDMRPVASVTRDGVPLVSLYRLVK